MTGDGRCGSLADDLVGAERCGVEVEKKAHLGQTEDVGGKKKTRFQQVENVGDPHKAMSENVESVGGQHTAWMVTKMGGRAHPKALSGQRKEVGAQQFCLKSMEVVAGQQQAKLDKKENVGVNQFGQRILKVLKRSRSPNKGRWRCRCPAVGLVV